MSPFASAVSLYSSEYELEFSLQHISFSSALADKLKFILSHSTFGIALIADFNLLLIPLVSKL